MKPILAQIENLSDFAYIYSLSETMGKIEHLFSTWIFMHHICIKIQSKMTFPDLEILRD